MHTPKSIADDEQEQKETDRGCPTLASHCTRTSVMHRASVWCTPRISGFAVLISMVLMLSSGSKMMASAWATSAGTAIVQRTTRSPLRSNLRRCLSEITSLTKERVRAIMEGIPTQPVSVPARVSSPSDGCSNENLYNSSLTISDLHKMKTSEIQAELYFRGLKSKGDRVLLINRLKKVLDEAASEDGDTSKIDALPTIDPGHLYVLRTKGNTTPQSRGMGVGLVLYDPENNSEVWTGRIYLPGDRSPFEAEYSAVILGMEYASQSLGVRRLLVQTSSDVIVQQIRGVYKVNKISLQKLLAREQEVERNFEDFAIDLISATANELSRELASKALATRKSFNVLLDSDGNLNLRDPIEVIDRTPTEDGRWKQADPPSFSAAIDPARTYLLRFDGGSRGNPGLAGAGMVLYDDQGQEIWCGWKFHDGAATNNLAEYLGLLCGLKCAKSFGIEKLIVEGDSQLIVRQLTGKYQCREESLKKFFTAARDIAHNFEYFEIRHIPRAENKRADWLANHAMDLQESGGFDQIQTEL